MAITGRLSAMEGKLIFLLSAYGINYSQFATLNNWMVLPEVACIRPVVNTVSPG
jgi:hypothetical protein